ncbi:metal ABC transporter permease [Chrysiogenes arsenatis]|uniref:metal ABC transporter permease n=1 Tax=Chrysiogenes arsenatis TaxID=309797 RepID=UPI00042841AA|nr:metal ABC transporter permease [Chrysiogenes arsenatis]
MFHDLFHFAFLQNALIAGLLAALVCGVLGSLVVVNRIVFIAGGIAHAAYGGIGIALFFGLAVLPTTLAFALGIAIIIALITRHQRHRTDSAIGVLWASGMALGVILMDLTPGYRGDLLSYLFGSILMVPTEELWLMAGLSAIVVAGVLLRYRELLALSYDDEFARVRGVPVEMLYFALLALLAIAVVVVIRIVGLILVIALFSIAPMMVERFSRSLASMICWSVVWNMVFVVAGLALSYQLNLTAGATIIAVAVTVYGVSILVLSQWKSKQRLT